MSLVVALIALYGAGVTSTLSPCVVPLVPGYLALVVDASCDTAGVRLRRVATFAAGAIGTFVVLGGVIASVGVTLGHSVIGLQRFAGVGLLVGAALMIFGKAGRLTGQFRLVTATPAQPYARAFLLGVGCGAAWSPCVGPLLGAALTAAAGSGSTSRGSLLLLAFGCGVLTPFCALASLPILKFDRRVSAIGRKLSTLSVAVMFGMGVLLTGGWYESVVQHLDVAR